jgi:hypothetical protein
MPDPVTPQQMEQKLNRVRAAEKKREEQAAALKK